MWTVDPGHSSTPGAARGYTILEITVVIVLFGIMALVVDRTLRSTADAQRFLRAATKTTERGHGVSYEIREQVSRSRRMFFMDDAGRDYLDALELGAFSRAAGGATSDARRVRPDGAGC